MSLKEQRDQAESLIYRVLDTVDKTKTNSDYYRKLFANMTDEDFLTFCKRRLPFRFHQEVFKVEPKMHEIFDAFKVLGKPLLEKVKLPYIYTNKDGVPVESQEALVIYIHMKRMKQMLTKKNSTALNIETVLQIFPALLYHHCPCGLCNHTYKQPRHLLMLIQALCFLQRLLSL